MKISMDLVRANEVVSCMKKEGNACKCCTKWLRRDLIRATVDLGHIPDWNAYDTEIIHEALTKRPLYFGHVHSYAISKLDNLPANPAIPFKLKLFISGKLSSGIVMLISGIKSPDIPSSFIIVGI